MGRPAPRRAALVLGGFLTAGAHLAQRLEGVDARVVAVGELEREGGDDGIRRWTQAVGQGGSLP